MNAAPHQLSLALEAQSPPPSSGRRLDVTIERIADIFDSLSDAEVASLAGKDWWSVTALVCRLRAMERGEEESRGCGAINSIADTYDKVVSPGEHPIEALIRTFKAHYTREHR